MKKLIIIFLIITTTTLIASENIRQGTVYQWHNGEYYNICKLKKKSFKETLYQHIFPDKGSGFYSDNSIGYAWSEPNGEGWHNKFRTSSSCDTKQHCDASDESKELQPDGTCKSTLTPRPDTCKAPDIWTPESETCETCPDGQYRDKSSECALIPTCEKTYQDFNASSMKCEGKEPIPPEDCNICMERYNERKAECATDNAFLDDSWSCVSNESCEVINYSNGECIDDNTDDRDPDYHDKKEDDNNDNNDGSSSETPDKENGCESFTAKVYPSHNFRSVTTSQPLNDLFEANKGKTITISIKFDSKSSTQNGSIANLFGNWNGFYYTESNKKLWRFVNPTLCSAKEDKEDTPDDNAGSNNDSSNNDNNNDSNDNQKNTKENKENSDKVGEKIDKSNEHLKSIDGSLKYDASKKSDDFTIDSDSNSIDVDSFNSYITDALKPMVDYTTSKVDVVWDSIKNKYKDKVFFSEDCAQFTEISETITVGKQKKKIVIWSQDRVNQYNITSTIKPIIIFGFTLAGLMAMFREM